MFFMKLKGVKGSYRFAKELEDVCLTSKCPLSSSISSYLLLLLLLLLRLLRPINITSGGSANASTGDDVSNMEKYNITSGGSDNASTAISLKIL